MKTQLEKKLVAEFPEEFLRVYGQRLHTVVPVLAEMASRGQVEAVYHSADFFRILVGAAEAVATEVKKRKDAAEWSPGWVL